MFESPLSCRQPPSLMTSMLPCAIGVSRTVCGCAMWLTWVEVAGLGSSFMSESWRRFHRTPPCLAKCNLVQTARLWYDGVTMGFSTANMCVPPSRLVQCFFKRSPNHSISQASSNLSQRVDLAYAITTIGRRPSCRTGGLNVEAHGEGPRLDSIGHATFARRAIVHLYPHHKVSLLPILVAVSIVFKVAFACSCASARRRTRFSSLCSTQYCGSRRLRCVHRAGVGHPEVRPDIPSYMIQADMPDLAR